MCPDESEKTTVIHGLEGTLETELKKAKEQEACLIIIRGTPQGHRYFISKDLMIIGRDTVADICVSDQSISRKHAHVTREQGIVKLTDLGSANGSFINDVRLSPQESVVLSKEDMIKLGNSIFKYLPSGELETLFLGNMGSAAHTDALTGIYNKGYLMDILESEIKRSRSLHTPLSLIFFDLDFFKKVNDTYGHDAGDYVLKEVTEEIRSKQIRPKDIFARYGGEEFVILLAGTSLSDAKDMAERVRASIADHIFTYEGTRLPVTTSVGVAQCHDTCNTPQLLLKAADSALYLAKRSGRNQVQIAS